MKTTRWRISVLVLLAIAVIILLLMPKEEASTFWVGIWLGVLIGMGANEMKYARKAEKADKLRKAGKTENYIMKNLWRAFAILAITVAVYNAYLEWFYDSGSGPLLSAAFLLILFSFIARQEYAQTKK